MSDNIDSMNLAGFYFKVKTLIKKYTEINLLEIRNDINKLFYKETLPMVIDFILTIKDEEYLVFLIGRSPKKITSEKIDGILEVFNKITKITGIILIWNTPTLKSIIIKSNLLNKLERSSLRSEFDRNNKDLEILLIDLIGEESYPIFKNVEEAVKPKDINKYFLNNFKSVLTDFYYRQPHSKDLESTLQKLLQVYPEIEDKLKQIIDKNFNINKNYNKILKELVEDINDKSN